MRVPEKMKLQELPLPDAMRLVSGNSPESSDTCAEVISLLPKPLANASAFLCALDHKWRYEYGEAYGIGHKRSIPATGTDQSPPVRVLYYGLRRLLQYLDQKEVSAYVSKLGNKQKHYEYLAELDPILRAKGITAIRYEPRPLGDKMPGPDWKIRFRDTDSCLIEVKCRHKQLFKLLNALVTGRDPSPHTSRMPVPDGLFKDTETKFPNIRQSGCTTQGVWIVSPVLFIESELRTSLGRLDGNKIGFSVVGRSWREYEVYPTDETDETWLNLHFSLPPILDQ